MSWYSAAQLAGVSGMNKSERGVHKAANREGWCKRRKTVGKGWLYSIDSLPPETRAALAAQEIAKARAESRELTETTENPTQTTCNLAKLTGWKQAEAEPRIAIYDAICAFHKRAKCTWPQAVAAYNSGSLQVDAPPKLATISQTTFETWRAKVKKRGRASLAPNYGCRRGTGIIDSQPAMANLIKAIIVDFPSKGPELILEAVQTRFNGHPGTQLPSLTTVRDWVTRYKADNAAVLLSIHNPDAWRSKYMAAYGDAAANITRLNQLWEMDASPADIICTDGRCKLLQVVDVYPRRKKFLVSSLTTATHYAALLRWCMLNWGVPEILRTDNGAAESGKHITRILDELAVELDLTLPFHSWEKPFVERGFRTLQHDLIEMLPGYCGHNVAEREAIRSKKNYAARLYDKDAAIEVTMSMAELQAHVDEWCDVRHHRKGQKALGGRSPFELVATWDQPIKTVDERALDLLLAESASNGGWRTVTKHGISVDGIKGYIAPELTPGDRVHVLKDEIDLGRVLVRQLDEATGNLEFLCWAVSPEFAGIDRREIAIKAKALQTAKTSEARKAEKANAKAQRTDDLVREILAKDREAAGVVTQLPPRTTEHTSHGLDAAAAAASAAAMPDAEVTPAMQAAIKAVEDDLKSRPKADVVQLQDTVDARYRRWHALDQRAKRAKRGEPLTDDETNFHARYPQTADYRSMHILFEDFPQALTDSA